MDDSEHEFLQQLLEVFRVEAEEHLQAITSGLLDLEREPDPERQPQRVEPVYRVVHSLKGASRAVGLSSVEAVCQALEGVLARVKSGDAALTRLQADGIHRVVDGIRGLILGAPPTTVAGVLAEVARIASGDDGGLAGARSTPPVALPPAAVPPAAVPPALLPPAPDAGVPEAPAIRSQGPTLRISADKIDALMLQAEELLAVRLALADRATGLEEVRATMDAVRAGWEKVGRQVQAAATNRFLDESLEEIKIAFAGLSSGLGRLHRQASLDLTHFGPKLDTLLEDVKRAAMLPCSFAFVPLQRVARDIAREEGKEVDLVVEGAEVEIDRRVLEELKDPLTHLVRNAVDHGIERPAERVLAGKPPRALVRLSVRSVDGNKVQIVVADDGAGIRLDRVRETALHKGVMDTGTVAALSDEAAMELVFRSGFSTSPIVTDISGRGLGLAIVREKVEKVGGTLKVDSRPGAGTTITLVIPITLANFRGLVVTVAERTFVFPASSVERVLRVGHEEVQTVEGRETVVIDGRATSFVRLSAALGIARAAGERPMHPAVLVGRDSNRVAFGVDEIRGEQEVLVKGLGPQLLRVRNIAGATVLGAERLALILNPSDLLASAALVADAGIARAGPEKGKAARKSILVAEDSVTSRTLLRGILEAAGYEVRTAVDGMDAWTTLQTSTFDLIVSDVEMPRMDGLELTTRIRGDQRFRELPVILVTALGTREDREKGIRVGANAYIVKSSFDQGNLLGIISQLA